MCLGNNLDTIPIGSMYGIFYLHLVDSCGKCRQMYHTWILWDMRLGRVLLCSKSLISTRPKIHDLKPKIGGLGRFFFRRGGHVQVPRQFWGSRLGPFAQISLNQLNKSLFIRPRDDLGCLSSHHEDSQIVSKEFLETFICHYNHWRVEATWKEIDPCWALGKKPSSGQNSGSLG